MQILFLGTHRPFGSALADRLDDMGVSCVRVPKARSLGHEVLRGRKYDACVHADFSLDSTRSRSAVDENLLGTRNVISHMSERDTPLYCLSSIVAQGPSRPNLPHVDVTPSRPLGITARSLEGRESLCLDSGLRHVCVLRLAIPYGFSGGFSRLCRYLQRSRLHPQLDGLELSFIHVDDVARFLVRAVSRPAERRFIGHLSDGITRNGADLLNAIERQAPPSIRLPMRLPTGAYRLLGQISRPFDGWNMTKHLGRSTRWSSRGCVVEDKYNFLCEENWRCHLSKHP